jgi:long-subunit fatty acid transport protein
MTDTKGGIDEIAMGIAVNLRDKLMIGGSLGVPILHYNRESNFLEVDATDNPNNQFNYAQVHDVLKTNGVGFNLKAGLIYKPSEYWRIGFAAHSPTLYSLTDRYETWIETDVENPRGVLTDYSIDYTGGNPSEFKYTHITPYKLMGSVSYVIREIQDVTKQRGFLTADVEYVNYKASSFSPDEESNNDQPTKDYLKQLNGAIDKAYKGAFNVRAGGELKFTTIMVRLGAAYYGNPYKDINGEKGSKLNLSGGLGYRNKGFFIDLTYVHAINKDVHFAYRLANAPYQGASLKNTAGNVFLTLGVKI